MSEIDIKTAFFIAYKTITKGHKSTVALIIFILSLSFFNLMFVSGFLYGFSDGIMKSMIDNSTAHIIVMPQLEPVSKDFIFDQDRVRAEIETISGVVGTIRHYELGGTFIHDKNNDGKFKFVSGKIIGVTQSEEKNILTVNKNMVSGKFPDVLKDDEIVLGANLSGGFGTKQTSDLGGATVGSKIQVNYSNGIIRTYTIVGIFKLSMVGSVASTAFISTKEAETILSAYNSASEILVKTDLEKNTLDEYVTQINELFPNFRLEKYTSRLSSVGILVTAFDLIAVIVSVVSIIVSAITIFVMIYINAVSKRRQIGILKAIGIKEGIIELSYVIQSLFYSILGIIGGFVVIFWIVMPIMTVRPIIMPFGNASLVYTSLGIVFNTISLIVAGILAGFIPAKIVTRENILKSIWG